VVGHSSESNIRSSESNIRNSKLQFNKGNNKIINLSYL